MRPRLLLPVLAAALAVVLAAAGCSSSPHSVQPGPHRPSIRPDLLARADLDPCPLSTAAKTAALPDVTLPCLGHGPSVHLAGLHGRPLVLNIWGSWCRPCQRETPFLSSTYDALRSQVTFLGVDTEETDPNSALDFAAHVHPPMRYPSVLDDQKAVLLGLGLSVAVPSTVFVTANGRVAHVSPGPYLSAAKLRADLSRYLGVSG